MIRFYIVELLIILFCIITPVSSYADSASTFSEQVRNNNDESSTFVGSSFRISIERVTVNNMQLNDTVDINLESGSTPIAGFELKIAIDSRLIDVVEVLPGRIPDSCGWEFFNARRITTDQDLNRPVNLWQIVALSETVPGGKAPLCHSFDSDASIARLVLSSEHAGLVENQSIPIYFYWEDCTDNTVSGLSGTTLALSKHVYHYISVPDPVSGGRFPNITGAVPECIDPSTRNQPKRMIDFHNGGILCRLKFEDLSVDSF